MKTAVPTACSHTDKAIKICDIVIYVPFDAWNLFPLGKLWPSLANIFTHLYVVVHFFEREACPGYALVQPGGSPD